MELEKLFYSQTNVPHVACSTDFRSASEFLFDSEKVQGSTEKAQTVVAHESLFECH